MAKKIVRVAKLEFMAGKAKPGPELAGLGIKMPDFTRAFNDKTSDRTGEPVPVVITVFNDKTFDFELKTAPAAFKLKKAAGIKSGSKNSKTEIAGKITVDQLTEIAKYKLVDLNTNNVEAAKKIIAGTAKNMGIVIEGLDDVAAKQAAAKQAAKDNQQADAKEAALKEAQEEAIEAKNVEGIHVNAISQGEDKKDEE